MTGDLENLKERLNPELTVALGDPAWTAYNPDGTPAKGAMPVYDDPRITKADINLIEVVVANPTKCSSKGALKDLYAAELAAK